MRSRSAARRPGPRINLSSYDPEKRQAPDTWARRLHTVVTGEVASKVVAIRSRAAILREAG